MQNSSTARDPSTLASLHPTEPREIPADNLMDDVASALLNLGYKEPLVRRAVAGVDSSKGGSLEDLLKQALKALMK